MTSDTKHVHLQPRPAQDLQPKKDISSQVYHIVLRKVTIRALLAFYLIKCYAGKDQSRSAEDSSFLCSAGN